MSSGSRNALKFSLSVPPAESLAVLRKLIFDPDNVALTLVNSKNEQVNINVLRWKHMVLLFSGPDISDDNIALLCQIYNNTCTIVWIPIAQNWNDALKESVRLKRSNIPGYSLECFLPMPRAISYISSSWKYNGTPKLVMLDQLGNVKTTRDVSEIPTKTSNSFPFF